MYHPDRNVSPVAQVPLTLVVVGALRWLRYSHQLNRLWVVCMVGNHFLGALHEYKWSLNHCETLL